jgi:hypothetical protein
VLHCGWVRVVACGGTGEVALSSWDTTATLFRDTQRANGAAVGFGRPLSVSEYTTRLTPSTGAAGGGRWADTSEHSGRSRGSRSGNGVGTRIGVCEGAVGDGRRDVENLPSPSPCSARRAPGESRGLGWWAVIESGDSQQPPRDVEKSKERRETLYAK